MYLDLVPERPPSHVLETASEKAFWNVLPDEWVFTPTGRTDYGIDGRVEIFAPTGAGGSFQTTWLFFSVQLKATADESTDAMRVGVSWGHVAYWQSLSEPVLVVRYLASTGALYGMWAHERGRERETAATVQGWFRFRETDRLTVACADEIADAVRAFRAARSRILHLPVELRLAGGKATASLEASWNAQLAARLADASVHVARSSSSTLHAVVDEALTINVGAGFAVSVHPGGAVGDPYTADDLLIALGFCFGRVGAFRDAVTCLRGGKASGVLWTPETLTFAVACCAEAGDHALAVELIEACPAPSLVQEPLLLLSLQKNRLDPALQSRMLYIQDLLVAQPNDDRERARAIFHWASLARSFGEHRAAVANFDHALAVWPGYELIPHWPADHRCRHRVMTTSSG
jgi:hypothetical protein